MAKISGPIASAMRGKVGQVVAAKTVGGETALRSYQPVVKNPNTKRQLAARKRFTFASGFTALFSEAVKIGFASVASGAKMYPRNLFLRELMDTNLGAMIPEGADYRIDVTKVQLSAKSGVDVAPNGSIAIAQGASVATLTLTNLDDVPLNEGEDLGIVIAVYGVSEGTVHLYQMIATETIEIPLTGLKSGQPYVALGFYKKVLPSYTSVEQQSIPWRYPSPTGRTAVVGNIIIQ